MPEVGNFLIRIQNAETGEYFDEYQIKTTNDQTECYIVSQIGQKFIISLGLPATVQSEFPNATYACHVYVDGQNVVNCLVGSVGRLYRNAVPVRGMEVEPGKEAPFLFGATSFTGKLLLEPQFTSLEEGNADKELLSTLGSIVIRVSRALARFQSEIPYKTTGVVEEPKINEKAKKALLTHSVK